MNTRNPHRPEDSMQIGFIGAGAIANAVASHLAGLRDGGRLMQVGTGPLPGPHLLTQHAEPAPREGTRA